MMTIDNQDIHNSSRDDPAATQTDARIRELCTSLPVPQSASKFDHANVERAVLAKIHRRRIAVRSTIAASLVVLLTAGWLLSTVEKDPQQPMRLVDHQRTVDNISPAARSIEEFKLFASAYQELSSPVVPVETQENRAWVFVLSSFEETMEIE